MILEGWRPATTQMTAQGEGGKGDPLHRSGGHSDDLWTEIVNMISSMLVAFNVHLAGGLLHHDRRHHYISYCWNAVRKSASCVPLAHQAQCPEGVQCRDLDHWSVLRHTGHHPQRTAADPRQYADPVGIRQQSNDSGAAAGCSRDPGCCSPAADHPGRSDPLDERCQVTLSLRCGRNKKHSIANIPPCGGAFPFPPQAHKTGIAELCRFFIALFCSPDNSWTSCPASSFQSTVTKPKSDPHRRR